MLIAVAKRRFDIRETGQRARSHVRKKLARRRDVCRVDTKRVGCVSDRARAYCGGNARRLRSIVVEIFAGVTEIRKAGYRIQARIRLVATVSIDLVATALR